MIVEKEAFFPHSELWDYYGARGNWHIVQYLRQCGLNIMPLICDGSKAPKIKWSEYQLTEVPSDLQKEYFFFPKSASGIGVICGISSGFLEILDFDGPHLFVPWCKEVASRLGGDFVRKLVVVQTPKGGWHVYYRCMGLQGNQKLAYCPEGKIQIETRGQGGQAVMPGSPLSAHVRHKSYRLFQGRFDEIPMIGADNHRAVMMAVARSFDLAPPKPPKATDWISRNCEGVRTADRPGDKYNRTVTWEAVLEPAGWHILREVCEVAYWQRPGKIGKGPSATTGYCASDTGNELMKVFSSNANPFEEGQVYDKFSAFAHLYHDGDFGKAAKALVEKGYGDSIRSQYDDEAIKAFFERHNS